MSESLADVSVGAGTAAGEAGFPFSAVVGQERLQLALILCAVHPGIGGVLVRGEKGTAKSTVVRALAQLLPPVVDEDGQRPARLVELPVGATEDRVVGSLDLQRVLRDGEQAFRPGLLAAAHHGVLYVDEVNLLHDHLVDVLLDAAAMGRVHIERDGVSHSHPARFVLVGTMNPEEGELRPQLLDRFGLTVDVVASRDVDVRMAVVRRRLDYEADPDGFAGRYAEADREIADRILLARDLLGEVELPEGELRRIAALCASFDVDGMRADLVVARTAAAHAAWRSGRAVTEQDVRIAAELALPHRRRRDPFDEPGISEEQLDEAMRAAGEEAARGEQESEAGTPGKGEAVPPENGAGPLDQGAVQDDSCNENGDSSSGGRDPHSIGDGKDLSQDAPAPSADGTPLPDDGPDSPGDDPNLPDAAQDSPSDADSPGLERNSTDRDPGERQTTDGRPARGPRRCPGRYGTPNPHAGRSPGWARVRPAAVPAPAPATAAWSGPRPTPTADFTCSAPSSPRPHTSGPAAATPAVSRSGPPTCAARTAKGAKAIW